MENLSWFIRGDGKEGEDITENLKTVIDIPHLIKSKNFPTEIDIRGEIFIQNSDFKKLKVNLQNQEMLPQVLLDKDPKKQKKFHLNLLLIPLVTKKI